MGGLARQVGRYMPHEMRHTPVLKIQERCLRRQSIDVVLCFHPGWWKITVYTAEDVSLVFGLPQHVDDLIYIVGPCGGMRWKVQNQSVRLVSKEFDVPRWYGWVFHDFVPVQRP